MSLEVLSQVCTVMRARRAQLVLAEPSGIPRRISLDDHGPSEVEPISLDTSSIVTQAIETRRRVPPQRRTTPQRRSSYDPIAGRYVHAVVAPLINENTAIGAIVALDRDEELDGFDDDDLRLFEALVAHASANLERARLVEELRFEVDSKSHQATHDMLTGLPNRMLFLSRATSALNDSGGVAIVLLDLDRFKDVNDTLGHAIGDRLLCEVSERLLRAVGEQATVARLGGDEFALVIADVTEPERAVSIVNELNAELSRPIEMDGLTLAVTASAGIALAPEHGDDVALLLQRADIAMYLAKERRSTVEVYSVEHDRSMRRWLMLGGLLTHALQTETELSVMYQPIADVRSRKIVQVEALARWNHPVHGAIPPEEFIGIAEQMGMISQISDFVLSEGCAQLARWRQAGIDIGLAINVSGREFADGSLVDRVATTPAGPRPSCRRPDARSDRNGGHGGSHPGDPGPRPAGRPGHPDRDRRLRHRLFVAGLSPSPSGSGIEDRPLLRDQPPQRDEQPHHRPLFHRHGALPRAQRRGRGRRGRGHVRDAGRRRM